MNSSRKNIEDFLKQTYDKIKKIKVKKEAILVDEKKSGFDLKVNKKLNQLSLDEKHFSRLEKDRAINSIIQQYNAYYGTKIFSLKSCSPQFLQKLKQLLAEWNLVQIVFKDETQLEIYCKINLDLNE